MLVHICEHFLDGELEKSPSLLNTIQEETGDRDRDDDDEVCWVGPNRRRTGTHLTIKQVVFLVVISTAKERCSALLYILLQPASHIV